MNILDKLVVLKQSKSEIQCIAKEIDGKKKNYLDNMERLKEEMAILEQEYIREIEPLRKKLGDIENGISSLGKERFPVRLGDLLNEISKLSGIESNRLKVTMDTTVEHFGACSYLTMFRMLSQDDMKHTIVFKLDGLSNNGKNRVNYIAYLPLDMEMQKENGGLLYKHCSLKYVNNDEEKLTIVVIDKNIDDVVLNFSLNQINSVDNFGWYPASLFTQAIINCVNKDNKNVKKRYRKM